jgi:hypothetical protein
LAPFPRRVRGWRHLLVVRPTAHLRMPAPRCSRAGWNSSLKFLPKIDFPPLPVPVGSPPCTMNPGTTRWKMTPL